MKTSGKYALGFLVGHPLSKEIVLKHMLPLGLGEDRLGHIDGSLREMYELNMGGGIPITVIEALMRELDRLPSAAFEGTTGEGAQP